MPGDTPDKVPADDIVAIADGVLLHVPPARLLPIAMLLPGQTGTLPVITPGNACTDTVAETLPHVVV